MSLLRQLVFWTLATILLFSAVKAQAAPPIPTRIGGTVTVDGSQITQSTDTGYTFVVTKQDGTAYVPAAEDVDGLNASNCYLINIPIYDADDQPGGANPGDTAVIHVYKNGSELTVISPLDGKITVGDSGTINQINLIESTSAKVVYVDPEGCNGHQPCFETIQLAINAISVNTLMLIGTGTFNEHPTLDRSLGITIQGGWDSSFSSQTAQSTIIKAPIVTSGSIVLQDLIVKP